MEEEIELEIDVLKDGSVSVRREVNSTKGQDLFDILSDVCKEEDIPELENFLVISPKLMQVPEREHTWCG